MKEYVSLLEGQGIYILTRVAGRPCWHYVRKTFQTSTRSALALSLLPSFVSIDVCGKRDTSERMQLSSADNVHAMSDKYDSLKTDAEIEKLTSTLATTLTARKKAQTTYTKASTEHDSARQLEAQTNARTNARQKNTTATRLANAKEAFDEAKKNSDKAEETFTDAEEALKNVASSMGRAPPIIDYDDVTNAELKKAWDD